jgi:hypothetical protein
MSTRPVLRPPSSVDAGAANTTDHRLNLPPNRCGRKFIYSHAPSSWLFMDEVGWVPSLDMHAAVPGVNGVPQTGDMSGLIAQIGMNGSVVISPKDARLGPFVDYIVRYETVTGTPHYCHAWEEPSILPDRTVVWDRKAAAAGHRAFLAYLRDESGLIDPMHEAIYLRERQKQEEKVNNLAARVGANPALKTEHDRAVKRIDDMRASWEAMQARYGDKPAPLPAGTIRAKGRADA